MSTTTETQLLRVMALGMVPYEAAWALQRSLVAARSAGQCRDTLLLLEHPPTITLGNKARLEHVLLPLEELARRGVALVQSDRGGDVTYHAPGQLVGYPILKLSRHGGDIGRYVRNIEETIIQLLASYGIIAGRVSGLTGVWIAPDDPLRSAKIAAIGVKLSASGVTSHGFALNIAPDLAGFRQIVPCGITNRGVTSIQALLGTAPTVAEVRQQVIMTFAAIFGVTPIEE